MKNARRFLTVGAVLLLATTVPVAVAAQEEDVPGVAPELAAPAVIGACNTNRTQFRIEINTVRADTTSYQNMPDTGFNINIGANNSCVLVVFTAETFVHDSNIQLRARIPGIGAAGVSEEYFLGRQQFGSFFRVRTMQFVFPSVPSGQRAVRMQFRCVGSCVTPFPGVRNRQLTVHFRG